MSLCGDKKKKRFHGKSIHVFHLLLAVLSFSINSSAQQKKRLYIRIIESDTRRITPAMVCITDLKTLKVHVPPDGAAAEDPAYPNIFYEGINYNTNKNWIGPIRKMSGPGDVNGQRTYVYGQTPTLPYWPEPVMYQTSGNFTVDLAPGRWRISIQHGNEYVPVSEEVMINIRQKEIKKTFLLKRWINLPQRGWYSGDVHAHHPLNKPAFKAYVLQLAKAEDVHLVNMLQMGDRRHTYFTPEGFGKAFRVKQGNTSIVSGQEEPRSDYGHIIGLNIQSLARDTAHYNYYDLVFNQIHRKPEALTGFAHFAYGGEGVKEGLALYAPTGAVDFVELLQNTKLNAADYYDYLNIGFRIAAAAGSDFPWGSTIGDARTFVYTGNPFSADKWFAGLKAGNTFVSNGPAIFLEADGKIPGNEMIRRRHEVVKVVIKALSNPAIGIIEKVVVYNNDGLLSETLNPKQLNSVTVEFSYALLKSQWLTAAVYCNNGALAHTSPLYFIVDGKPAYDVVKGPAIIEKLLAVLKRVKASEMAKPTIDSEIMERIDKAESYYRRLAIEMKAGSELGK